LRHVESNAADRHAAIEALAGGDHQPGDLTVQIERRDDVRLRERLPGQCGDRYRRFLQIDILLLRNHRDRL